MLKMLARLLVLLAAASAVDAAFSCFAAGRTGAECAALDALYTSGGGDGWARRAGWATAASGAVPGPDYCTFDGVDCDADGHVTAIALPRNGLSGTVPPDLAELTRLKTLDLSYNALSGTLPAALGQLTQLRRLALSSNLLHGGLPDSLSSLTLLQSLELTTNIFDGELPGWLAQLPQLSELYLGGNYFSGPVPPALGDVAARFTNISLGPNLLDSAAFPPPLCAFACSSSAPPFMCPIAHSCAAALPDCAPQCRFPRCPATGLSAVSFAPLAAACADPSPRAACLTCLPAIMRNFYAAAAGDNSVLEGCLVEHSAEYVAAGADPFALGAISNCGSLYGFGRNSSSCPVTLGTPSFAAVAAVCGASASAAAACDGCLGTLTRIFAAAGVSIASNDTPGASSRQEAMGICADAHVLTLVAAGADPGVLARLPFCPALALYATHATLLLFGITTLQLQAPLLVAAVAAAAGTLPTRVYVTEVVDVGTAGANVGGGRRALDSGAAAQQPTPGAALRCVFTITAANVADVARNAGALSGAVASGQLLRALQAGGTPVTQLRLTDVATVADASAAPAKHEEAAVSGRTVGIGAGAAACVLVGVASAMALARIRARTAQHAVDAAAQEAAAAGGVPRGRSVLALAAPRGGITYLVAV